MKWNVTKKKSNILKIAYFCIDGLWSVPSLNIAKVQNAYKISL